MKLADTLRVAEIHVYGWRNAYRGIVSDDYLFNKMTVSKSADRFENAVRDNTEESYVFDDGILKAFMTIGSCRDADKTESFELWGIYVDPFMQRQGIGSQMISFCETKAIERGHKEICLWVFEKNENARAFYEKFGYLPDGNTGGRFLCVLKKCD
jgi:GNAT superfamily N-acetyltransferase